METKQVEKQVLPSQFSNIYLIMCCGSLTPVLEEVRHITIGQTSRSGFVALVSYEHKVGFLTWVMGGLLTFTFLLFRLLGTPSALET